jgi:hypothetical protein
LDVSDQLPEVGGALREEVARLEERIEALTESLDRCQKISLMARLVLAGGAVWLVLIVLRILPFAPFSIVGAIAALLGGIVLYGANTSTWKQTLAAIAQAEALRAHLIGRLEMQTVEESEAGAEKRNRAGFIESFTCRPRERGDS